MTSVCGGWVWEIGQRAELALWGGPSGGVGVLAEGWVGLQVWEEKEIVTETRVMEAECRFHLSVSSVGFKKRQTWGEGLIGRLGLTYALLYI